MSWLWASLAILLFGLGLLLRHRAGRKVDEEHCPYKVGTDRTDCGGTPCEAEPPCRVPNQR